MPNRRNCPSSKSRRDSFLFLPSFLSLSLLERSTNIIITLFTQTPEEKWNKIKFISIDVCCFKVLDDDGKRSNGDRGSTGQQGSYHGQHRLVVRVAEAEIRGDNAPEAGEIGRQERWVALLPEVQAGGGTKGANLRGHPKENGERDEREQHRRRAFMEFDRHRGPTPAQAQDEASSTHVQGETAEDA